MGNFYPQVMCVYGGADHRIYDRILGDRTNVYGLFCAFGWIVCLSEASFGVDNWADQG